MDTKEAFQIVIDLARQNLAPDDLPEEQARQEEAISIVESFASGTAA